MPLEPSSADAPGWPAQQAAATPAAWSAPATQGDAAQDGKATAALVLGLVGLLAWILPIVGLPLGIVGIVMGVKGLKSTKRGMATAGLVLSILCVVASLVNAAVGVMLFLDGMGAAA